MEKSARMFNGRTIFFITALACAAACAGGGGSQNGASDTGDGLTLSGKILDGSSPASGAVITVAGPNETTTADGNGDFAVVTSESGPAIGITIAASSFSDSFVVENIPEGTEDIELVLAYRRGVIAKEHELEDDEEDEDEFEDEDFDDDDDEWAPPPASSSSSSQSSSKPRNPARGAGSSRGGSDSTDSSPQLDGWLDCEMIVFRDGRGEVLESRLPESTPDAGSSSSEEEAAGASSSVSSASSSPAPTAAPTAAPTPSGPFDADGNTTDFGIPGGLKGNINAGSRVWSGKCSGCHGSEKSNKSYSAIKSSLKSVNEMRGVNLSNQQIADVTAYLNRRRR